MPSHDGLPRCGPTHVVGGARFGPAVGRLASAGPRHVSGGAAGCSSHLRCWWFPRRGVRGGLSLPSPPQAGRASLGLRFLSLVVAPAAGARSTVDWYPFLDAGCVVSADGNLEVLKSPIGERTWCEDFAGATAVKQASWQRLLGRWLTRKSATPAFAILAPRLG